MDPAKLAEDLLQKHFPKFGSFRKLCTYHSLGPEGYDASTGMPARNELGPQQVWIIFDMASQAAAANLGLRDDDPLHKELRVAIIPKLDLHFKPKITDEITREDSSVWQVIGVIEDPGPAHYELLVRPVGPHNYIPGQP